MAELADLSDEVWQRIRVRLDGLTDEEYFWEPAPGCWSIRQRSDGTWLVDWPLPRPDPEPFTTIAWRLWHLIDMYGEDRAPRWLDVEPQGEPIGMDDPAGAPAGTAAGALDLLERAHARWDAHLALVTEESLTEPVGAVAGPNYADRSRMSYVLHMLDEFVHHGAEIATLRDLWRWQHPLVGDGNTDRVMRGDMTIVNDPAFVPSTAHLDVAAQYGRWDLLVELVRRGAPMRSSGKTPLHLAAGAGELDVVKTLLECGADPNARDPEFNATPRQWGEFLRHPHLVEYFDALDESRGSS